MKKSVVIILLLMVCFSLVSCGNQTGQIETKNNFELGDIIFTLPEDWQIDTRTEESVLFSNGVGIQYFQSMVNDRGKYDAAYEEMIANSTFENVSKCEFNNMPTISFASNGHPGYFVFDLENASAYAFYFNAYLVEDETSYVNIMESIRNKEAN